MTKLANMIELHNRLMVCAYLSSEIGDYELDDKINQIHEMLYNAIEENCKLEIAYYNKLKGVAIPQFRIAEAI